MSGYLCAWSIHGFYTRAGPGAVLISQSRVTITFAFPLLSSKPKWFPTLIFSDLLLWCFLCPMIWILEFGFFLPEIFFCNLINRISSSELVDGSVSTSPFLFFVFQGAALALHLSGFSENSSFPDLISYLRQGSSVPPSIHNLSKSLVITRQLRLV